MSITTLKTLCCKYIAAGAAYAALLGAFAAPARADRPLQWIDGKPGTFRVNFTAEHDFDTELRVTSVTGVGPTWTFAGTMKRPSGLTPVTGTLTKMFGGGYRIQFKNTLSASAYVTFEGAINAKYGGYRTQFMAGGYTKYWKNMGIWMVFGPNPFCAESHEIEPPP